jgi:hypothetical protein
MASGTLSLFFPVLRFWEGKMRPSHLAGPLGTSSVTLVGTFAGAEGAPGASWKSSITVRPPQVGGLALTCPRDFEPGNT